MTVGFGKWRRRARRRVPSAQAVSAVKVVNWREESCALIAEGSVGGVAKVIAVAGRAAIVDGWFIRGLREMSVCLEAILCRL